MRKREMWRALRICERCGKEYRVHPGKGVASDGSVSAYRKYYCVDCAGKYNVDIEENPRNLRREVGELSREEKTEYGNRLRNIVKLTPKLSETVAGEVLKMYETWAADFLLAFFRRLIDPEYELPFVLRAKVRPAGVVEAEMAFLAYLYGATGMEIANHLRLSPKTVTAWIRTYEWSNARQIFHGKVREEVEKSFPIVAEQFAKLEQKLIDAATELVDKTLKEADTGTVLDVAKSAETLVNIIMRLRGEPERVETRSVRVNLDSTHIAELKQRLWEKMGKVEEEIALEETAPKVLKQSEDI